MLHLKVYLSCCVALILGACSHPVAPPQKPATKNIGTFTTPSTSGGPYNQISMGALEQELGMAGGGHNLGYVEKSFNACQVSANRSSNPKCENLYFGRLNFVMSCRNNPGIVQSSQMLPLQLSHVRWKAGRDGGGFSTNSQGQGVIHFISKSTARFRPMKFYIGRKIVYKRLKDNWKIVLPRDWCPKV